MNKNMMLLAVMLICSCIGKKEQETKAPIRVKTELAQTSTSTNGQTYVGRRKFYKYGCGKTHAGE